MASSRGGLAHVRRRSARPVHQPCGWHAERRPLQSLQNVALLHKRLFMDLGAMPPLYLHAPGAVLTAEGVDGLSRETARAWRVSKSLPALRRVVMAEATVAGDPPPG